MKRILLALLVGLCIGTGYAATAIRSVQMPNHTPLVSFRLIFGVGAARDPVGKAGLASLTASMLGNGGTRTLTYKQTVNQLYPTAASIHTQVDKEMTVFYGTTHVDTLDRYYRLLADKMLDPGWRTDDLARVRSDLINEVAVDLRGNNDEELGKEALYSLIYVAHPYGHPNDGLVGSLSKLTLQDVQAFYRQYYTQANLTIGLAGGYSPGFPARVDKDFHRLPAGSVPALRLPDPARFAGMQVQIVKKTTDSTAISFGFPIVINRPQEDWPALWLATSWLGQHRSDNSFLYQRMRQLRGLNYGDYAYIEYFPHGMFDMHPSSNMARQQEIFQVWIRPVEPKNAHFALRNAMYELKKLVTNGMSPKDFEDTRQFLSRFVYVDQQSQDQRLGFALDSRYYGMGEFTSVMQTALAKMTVDDVNRAVRKYLQADNIKVIIVTGDNAGKLANALKTDAASPIHYDAPKPQDILDEDEIISHFPLKPVSVEIVPVSKVFQ